MNEELKPCPFCGAEAVLTEHEPHDHSPALVALTGVPAQHPGSWTVECVACSCGMIHGTREEVEAAWNRRAPSASIADTAGAKPVAQVSIRDGFIVGGINYGLAEGKHELFAAPPAPSVADADFKNFHRLLCERFGYEHDEQHWKRDQLSLIEHLAWGRCTTPSQEERRSESIDCGECACLPGFCDKEGEIRSVLRLIVNKIDEEGPASRDWKGFNQLCELAKELLESAPSVADAAGASYSDGQLHAIAHAQKVLRGAQLYDLAQYLAKESGND